MKISEIAFQVRKKIPVSNICPNDYVSTDNMRPNFGGVEPSSSLPPYGTVTAFQPNDILLSNIRPYFRKIWLATHHGGCNADVLCIRTNATECLPKYLYYLLTTDNFIRDYLKSCKGAKMPRGDVKRLLDYEFNLPPMSEQLRIAGLITSMIVLLGSVPISRFNRQTHRPSISVNRLSISAIVGIVSRTTQGRIGNRLFPNSQSLPQKTPSVIRSSPYQLQD